MNFSVQVEIKRTIPKGSSDSKDFKTKKIFVGGIPTSVTEGKTLNNSASPFIPGPKKIIKLMMKKKSHNCLNIFLLTEELKDFFSKYGNVVEHEIIRDHTTKRSRGFGFVVFDSEQVVDSILVDTNKIDMNGTKVRYFYYILQIIT